MPVEAILYDGETAVRHSVVVAAAGGAIEIAFADGRSETVGPAQLKVTGSNGDTLRVSRAGVPGWRLLIPAGSEASVLALVGKEERYGRWIDRLGLVPAAVAFACVAIGVVALGYAAPQWVAPHVPAAWERNLGNAIVGDFGDLRCRSSEGQRALEAMVERLAPGALEGRDALKIAALDVPVFNAAALPGGHIVIFKSAITETEPDELAGLVAHEIAHVRRRHVTEALIRELGISALIGLFAGTVGTNAEQLVALSYSRENEAEADADAIAMLRRANISPVPTAKMFQRLAKDRKEGSLYGAEFLSSHPLSEARSRRFAAAFDRSATYRPALSRDQSDVLFNICWKGPRPS